MVRTKLNRFRLADVAQQFLGALILGAGFIIPPDVWLVSEQMSTVRVLLTLVLVSGIAYLGLYSADQTHDVERERTVGGVPLRLVSLFVVSGLTATAIVVFLREPSFYGATLGTTLKAILVTSLFTTISATVADSVL
ncbi:MULTISPECIES: DUF2391 domain-containing protein [unclassified Haladaptatus]|uniref:DUF2391 domain-containing protein n=1 Tax=unclassified Haladaptatus TaxID=2622732 RepID=UPI00209C1905|nr:MULTISPECIES: DUF2391 domain-containing protein [unclassified Haladaptatus]MCO8246304.1 DUF2391 domain-containing protein [Haladaptatus sp. AB643]MCO8255207.1 DUF2391 domain-containing protein [Haladaptatus sp. AB618]